MQIQVPDDYRLIDYMRTAHDNLGMGGKLEMSDELRAAFWEQINYYDREYHDYMKWYGDEHAVEKRIFDKFKRGLSE